MNNKLDKAISKLESQKNKEIEKISQINERISEIDNQLKPLYDYKKQQEKFVKLQQELEIKINEELQ